MAARLWHEKLTDSRLRLLDGPVRASVEGDDELPGEGPRIREQRCANMREKSQQSVRPRSHRWSGWAGENKGAWVGGCVGGCAPATRREAQKRSDVSPSDLLLLVDGHLRIFTKSSEGAAGRGGAWETRDS